MPLIEEKEKPQPEGLTKPAGPSIFSKIKIIRPKPRIRINWKPVKKAMRKFLKDMWEGD